ncbi:hypothetical protein IAU59_003397 [Kwoniella sp. CBS 9459]
MSATNATKIFGLRSALRLNPYVPRQPQGRSPFLSSSSATTSAAAPISHRPRAEVSPIRHRASSSRSYATSSLDSATTSSHASTTIESRNSDSSTRSASASASASESESGFISKPVISRATFEKLHKLSALNPPPEGSEEEAELMQGLSDLIHLMDKVKSVELPESVDERAGLLVEGIGIGEVVVSDRDLDWDREQAGSGLGQEQGQGQGQDPLIGSGGRGGSTNDDSLYEAGTEQHSEPEKRGKELLGWATNRVGDFYASRIKPKS